MARTPQPPSDQEQLNTPPGPAPLLFEKFNGINTATTRPGVSDEQMAWCDGWFPLGPRYLRTLWDVGPALWTVPSGTIEVFDFANIGTLPVMIAVTSLGGIWQVVTNTVGANVAGTATQIAPNGTIQNPGIVNVDISQWGSQYILIVANQTNGYWIWDGSILYTAGGLAPGVTLTNVGSGYTMAPSINATGGEGSGATFSALVSTSGQITKVNITNPGTGYLASDTVMLSFSGGNQAGSGASLTAVLSFSGTGSGAQLTVTYSSAGGGASGYASSVVVNNGGSGYSSQTTVNMQNGFGNPAGAISLTTNASGVITGATITSGGSYQYYAAGGYHGTSGPINPTITDNGYYYVSSVTIGSGGTGYGPSAAITASSGGSPQSQAIIAPVLAGGVIVGTTITSGGVYLSNSPPTLMESDTKTNAAGTVTLMPYAIQGTAIETYSGHVWIANGAVLTFSAPGSVSDFSTADGGGNTTSVDSFLRVAYTSLVNSNGFLYLIGDSSVNYISGVQTVSSTTTFTNQNADPEVGTPYSATVDVFNRNIVFANAFGAHVSYGAAVTKISDQLDGVYSSVPNFNGQQISACKAIIFGRKVWAMLIPVIDPISGLEVNKLFIWDSKKWVTSQQSVALTYVQHQEIASIITAWGTDGLKVYPLFYQPSASFTKTVQTRLWDNPGGYWNQKAAVRVWAMASFLSGVSPVYQISVDNENGIPSSAVYLGAPSATVTWTNNSGVVVYWTTSGGQTAVWYIVGAGTIAVLPPQAVGQQGVLIGETITTQCADMILISTALQPEIVGYRG